MEFYTSVNGQAPVLSPNAKAAVSKGLKAARAGNVVEITFKDEEGDLVRSDIAHARLEKLLNAPAREVQTGNTTLHNALIKVAMLAQSLAKVSLKKDLEEEQINNLELLISELQTVLYE